MYIIQQNKRNVNMFFPILDFLNKNIGAMNKHDAKMFMNEKNAYPIPAFQKKWSRFLPKR